HRLAEGFDWSLDSKALIFAEQLPDQPPQIFRVRPEQKREPLRLIEGMDWKAQPQWLGATRVIYRSDRESDHVNLWNFDTETSRTTKLIDCDSDIIQAWAVPAPESSDHQLLYTRI